MLTLDDDLMMLKDAAQAFLSDASPVSAFRSLRDSRDARGFNAELWRGYAEMGWTGMIVPETSGGNAIGHVGVAVLAEEMGRRLVASPFLSTAVVAASLLAQLDAGSEAASRLSAIAAGSCIVALAVDEAGKHDDKAIALSAGAEGDGFRIDGRKTMVMDGHVADMFLVAARTSGEPDSSDGITLFLVDKDMPGLRISRTMTVDSRNFAQLQFTEVTVAAQNAIGPVGGGYPLLRRALDAGCVALAAEMLGIAQECFERTVQYLSDRQQFGRSIGANQALQHRAAHLYCEIELVRSAVLAAAQALDGQVEDAGAIASVAKAKANEVAKLAVNEAVQMHGGIGMTDEFDIGLFMKRARVCAELFGDTAFHADRVALARGY